MKLAILLFGILAVAAGYPQGERQEYTLHGLGMHVVMNDACFCIIIDPLEHSLLMCVDGTYILLYCCCAVLKICRL